MGIGAHIFDSTPPPPDLKRALNYKSWGIADVMSLPAGMLPRINTALSYYNALMGYKSAGNRTVEWTKTNPKAWEMVSWIIAQRKAQTR